MKIETIKELLENYSDRVFRVILPSGIVLIGKIEILDNSTIRIQKSEEIFTTLDISEVSGLNFAKQRADGSY